MFLNINGWFNDLLYLKVNRWYQIGYFNQSWVWCISLFTRLSILSNNKTHIRYGRSRNWLEISTKEGSREFGNEHVFALILIFVSCIIVNAVSRRELHFFFEIVIIIHWSGNRIRNVYVWYRNSIGGYTLRT